MDYIDYLIYLEDLPPELKFPIFLGVWIIALSTIILLLFRFSTGGSDDGALDNSQTEEEIRHDVRKFLQPDGIDEFSLLERRNTPPRGRANLLYLKTCPTISIEGIEDEKLQNLIQNVDDAFDKWEKEDALIDNSSNLFRDMGEHLVQTQIKRDKISQSRRIRFTTSSVLEQSPIIKKTSSKDEKLQEFGDLNILNRIKDNPDDEELESEESEDEKRGFNLSLDENEDGILIGGLDDDDNLDFNNSFLPGDGSLTLPTENIESEDELTFRNVNEKEEEEEDDDSNFPKFELPKNFQNFDGGNDDDDEDEDEEEIDDEDDIFGDIDVKGFEERTNAKIFNGEQKEFLKQVYDEFATGIAQ